MVENNVTSRYSSFFSAIEAFNAKWYEIANKRDTDIAIGRRTRSLLVF